MSTAEDAQRIAVRVRAADGTARDDAWVETAHRPLAARLGEGLLVAGGGTLVGIMLLPIPLIHLFGIMFALSTWWVGIQRARTTTVVSKAGGTCPHCETAGRFFSGFGRKRFRLPLSTSCPSCSHALTLESLPGAAPPNS